MATLCEKCGRRDLVSYQVEPQEAWRLVVQSRWRHICPNCFDGEAERDGVRYQFAAMRATSWSGTPQPTRRATRKRS